MALYYHAELDRVTEGPATAQANMAQSGWRKLSDEEADQYYADQREEVRAQEEAAAARVELNPSVVAAPAETAPEGDAPATEAPSGEVNADPATTEKGK